MTTPALIEDDGTAVRAWLPAAPCRVCDRAIEMVAPTPIVASRDGLPMGATQYAHVACPEHEITLRVSTRDGRYVLTVRGVRDGKGAERGVWLPLWQSLSHPGKARSVETDSALSVLSMPDLWGVALGVDTVENRLALMHAIHWAVMGHAAVSMRAWMDAGVVTPRVAAGWNRQGLGIDEAGAWIASGVGDPVAASGFKMCGLSPDDDREGFVDPLMFAFTHAARCPGELAWGQVWAFASPRFAEHGYAQRKSPGEVEVLARALTEVRGRGDGEVEQHVLVSYTWRGPWSRDMAKANETLAARLRGLDWTDAAVCVRAGMAAEEIVAYLSAGKDMEPVRAMAALNAPHPNA